MKTPANKNLQKAAMNWRLDYCCFYAAYNCLQSAM